MAVVDALLRFFERGGAVLQAIVLASTLMWILIAERYLLVRFILPNLIRRRTEHGRALALLDRLELTRGLEDSISPIRALIHVLPLLGLLGTVVGMVETFEALRVVGNRDAAYLSDGISRALLTTMAGVAASLSGLFFEHHLSRTIRRTTRRIMPSDDVRGVDGITSMLRLRARIAVRSWDKDQA